MHIPDIGDIVTPVDDPCQFDPAWRSCVAQYLFECGAKNKDDLECISKTGGINVYEVEDEVKDNKKTKKRSKKKVSVNKEKKCCFLPIEPFIKSAEYRCFAIDRWIISYVCVLDAISRGYPSTRDDAGIRLAKRWYEEYDHEAAMKKRLEALLLTGIGIDVITLDLIGQASAQPAFEAYERLFYNCRDDDWKLNSSAQLIQRMAMPYGPPKTFMRKFEELDSDGFVIGDGRPIAKDSDVWKAIAATLGYDALIYTWKWDRFAHGLKDNSLENIIELSWRVATSRLFTALYTGDICHEDAARVLTAYTAQAKKITDDRNGHTGNEDTDTTKALMNILYMVSPKMITIDSSEEAARNEEIQNRIQSQLAISKQEIVDKGKQVENEVIDAQINNAVGGVS